MSEFLLFAEHGENMLCTKIVLNVKNDFCTQHVLPRFELGIFMYWTCNSINNLSLYCGLVDAKIRGYDKDLPVRQKYSAIHSGPLQVFKCKCYYWPKRTFYDNLQYLCRIVVIWFLQNQAWTDSNQTLFNILHRSFCTS